jgi:hypothetical protein
MPESVVPRSMFNGVGPDLPKGAAIIADRRPSFMSKIRFIPPLAGRAPI